MKLVIAIVHAEDAGALVDALTDKEYRVTRLHSTGGFLKQNKPADAKTAFADAAKKYEEVVAKYPEFERVNRARYGQALCFIAGANSIFYGPKLLTTANPARDRDRRLLDKLGLVPMPK